MLCRGVQKVCDERSFHNASQKAEFCEEAFLKNQEMSFSVDKCVVHCKKTILYPLSWTFPEIATNLCQNLLQGRRPETSHYRSNKIKNSDWSLGEERFSRQ